MIVCSCSMITDKDIVEAVTALRTTDPLVVLTPVLIYRYLGKRPSCGSCLPLISKLDALMQKQPAPMRTTTACQMSSAA
jgi:bacterioferritin-associated ferredoxin